MAKVKRSKKGPIDDRGPWVLKSGEILTEEIAEALADEAEVGYDLSLAHREFVGRPSLGEGVSPRVSFRAPPKLYDALRERAEKEGRSVSDVAREAMERYVTMRDR